MRYARINFAEAVGEAEAAIVATRGEHKNGQLWTPTELLRVQAGLSPQAPAILVLLERR